MDLPSKGGKTALLLACAVGRDAVVSETLASTHYGHVVSTDFNSLRARRFYRVRLDVDS